MHLINIFKLICPCYLYHTHCSLFIAQYLVNLINAINLRNLNFK